MVYAMQLILSSDSSIMCWIGFCFRIYLDKALKDEYEHMHHITEVFNRFRHYVKQTVKFLGYRVSAEGIQYQIKIRQPWFNQFLLKCVQETPGTTSTILTSNHFHWRGSTVAAHYTHYINLRITFKLHIVQYGLYDNSSQFLTS